MRDEIFNKKLTKIKINLCKELYKSYSYLPFLKTDYGEFKDKLKKNNKGEEK